MQERDLADLLTKSRTRLRFRYSHLVEPAIEGMKRLLAEPEDYRKDWILDAGVQDDPDDGLIPRNGGEHDKKFFFHYRPRIRRLLDAKGVDYSAYEDWFQVLHELHGIIQGEAEFVAGHLDQVIPELNFLPALKASEETVLRILWYNEVNYDNVIAKPHTDRSAMTVHLCDNYPGLMTSEGLIETKKDDALLFVSQKLDILSGGKIHCLPHQAIVDRIPPGEKRWVLVAFVNTDTPNIPMSYAMALDAWRGRDPWTRLSSWDIGCHIADKDPIFGYNFRPESFMRALDLLVEHGWLEEVQGEKRFFRATDKGRARMVSHPGEWRGIFRN